eukprot:CAMPEP_0174263064 /NCGR_PEP_ID=MMETSP0439-20130205/17050_1 /TAXON_ID=0 /ORGANISM="Stereomyxa ramosa, Strain Chinc5" /LENGTH=349 /DNA_ID=CAMNT_0015348195 /DNA_START=68 /DNA_END=1114 /DNA_ORIENTATION=+
MKFTPLLPGLADNDSTQIYLSKLGLGSTAFAAFYNLEKAALEESDGVTPEEKQKDFEKQCTEVLRFALESGVNYIDTSPWYGNAEVLLGEALKQFPREAFYLGSKLGRQPSSDPAKIFDFSRENVFRSVKTSLERLGVEYLDLCFAHDVEFAQSPDIIINETLPALQELKEQGAVRHIGITGYPIAQLLEIVNKTAENGVGIDVILSYARNSLNDKTLLSYLDDFNQKGVGVICAAPISMGLLSPAGPPRWHPADAETKLLAKNAVDYCLSQGVDICKLAMYFSLSCDRIPCVVVSTSSLELMKKNVSSAQSISDPLPLSTQERDALSYILTNFFSEDHHWENVEVQKH